MCEKRKKEKKVITCFKQVNFDIKLKKKKFRVFRQKDN